MVYTHKRYMLQAERTFFHLVKKKPIGIKRCVQFLIYWWECRQIKPNSLSLFLLALFFAIIVCCSSCVLNKTTRIWFRSESPGLIDGFRFIYDGKIPANFGSIFIHIDQLQLFWMRPLFLKSIKRGAEFEFLPNFTQLAWLWLLYELL